MIEEYVPEYPRRERNWDIPSREAFLINDGCSRPRRREEEHIKRISVHLAFRSEQAAATRIPLPNRLLLQHETASLIMPDDNIFSAFTFSDPLYRDPMDEDYDFDDDDDSDTPDGWNMIIAGNNPRPLALPWSVERQVNFTEILKTCGQWVLGKMIEAWEAVTYHLGF